MYFNYFLIIYFKFYQRYMKIEYIRLVEVFKCLKYYFYNHSSNNFKKTSMFIKDKNVS